MREGLLAVGSSQLSVGGSLQPGCYAPITDNRQRTTVNGQRRTVNYHHSV